MVYGISLGIQLILFVAIRLAHFLGGIPRDRITYNWLRVGLFSISIMINSYYVFDTWVGTILCIVSMAVNGYLVNLNTIDDKSQRQRLLMIVVVPVWMILIMNVSGYLIMPTRYSIGPMTILCGILFGQPFPESTWKDWVSSGIAIVLGIVVMYWATDGFKPIDSYSMQIARDYATNELNYTVEHIRAEPCIRGEKCEVYIRVNRNTSKLCLIYQDGQIIEWYEIW